MIRYFWNFLKIYIPSLIEKSFYHMPKKLYKAIDTEEFIEKAHKVHGEQYDYGEVLYEHSKKPVKILCKKHNVYFMQTPNAHLRGAGCPLCGREKTIKGKTWTTERFIKAAREVHGDAYDYSKVVYVKTSQKVCIICKRCGREFWQTPNSHLAGHGCEVCSYIDRSERMAKGKDLFIDEARAIWGDFYDYSTVVYKNIKTPVDITCPTHGVFSVTPQRHLSHSAGCPQCHRESRLIYGVAVDDAPNCEPQCRKIWMGMLHRCYYEKELERHPTYRGCSVCEEWLRLSNFIPFWEANYRQQYELEKDILVKGNKIYSPETCCFVPRRINILLTNRRRFRGGLPVGVCASESGLRYKASYDRDGKSTLIGYYDSAEEAFLAYKKAKEAYIKDVAQEYFEKGIITKLVRDALFRYEIEITD